MIIIYSVRSSVHLFGINLPPLNVPTRKNVANQFQPLYTIPKLNRVFKDQMVNNGPVIIKVTISKVKSAVFIFVLLFIVCIVRKFSLDKGWRGFTHPQLSSTYKLLFQNIFSIPIADRN